MLWLFHSHCIKMSSLCDKPEKRASAVCELLFSPTICFLNFLCSHLRESTLRKASKQNVYPWRGSTYPVFLFFLTLSQSDALIERANKNNYSPGVDAVRTEEWRWHPSLPQYMHVCAGAWFSPSYWHNAELTSLRCSESKHEITVKVVELRQVHSGPL